MKNVLYTDKPLLVIDSGLGGLRTFLALQDAFPNLSLLYHGDSAFAPYGEKTKEFLLQRVLKILRFFASQHQIQGVLVACNTTASNIQTELRSFCTSNHLTYQDILEGSAMLIDQCQKSSVSEIGVLATTATTNSGIYQSLGERANISTHVICCPELVPLLESTQTTSEELRLATSRVMEELFSHSTTIQHVLLGCTHYPFLLPYFQECRPQITFLDPSVALLQSIQASAASIQKITPANIPKIAKSAIYVSGESKLFQERMSNLITQVKIPVQTLHI